MKRSRTVLGGVGLDALKSVGRCGAGVSSAGRGRNGGREGRAVVGASWAGEYCQINFEEDGYSRGSRFTNVI